MSYQQESPQPFRWHNPEFDDSNFQIRGRTLFFIVVLFSVVLLITLLFLYGRWVCTLNPPSPSSSPPGALLVHPPPPRPRGLDSAAISRLPIVLHTISAPGGGGNFVEGECCICLGLFGDGDKVKVLPRCHHCFHSECVDMWLTAQPSCPLCRASLGVDSPV